MDNRADNLEDILKKEKVWPLRYPFKFIVPNDLVKLESVKLMLPDPSRVTIKSSKTGKYFSLTGIFLMPNPKSIIDIYKSVAEIGDVIAL